MNQFHYSLVIELVCMNTLSEWWGFRIFGVNVFIRTHKIGTSMVDLLVAMMGTLFVANLLSGEIIKKLAKWRQNVHHRFLRFCS